jgi:hypothetical protein
MKEPRLVQDYPRDILEGMDKAEEFIGCGLQASPGESGRDEGQVDSLLRRGESRSYLADG